MKSLALASRPQVLENWPVLGSRTALFFELLKFCGAPEKIFWKTFFCGDRLKIFCEDLCFKFFVKTFFSNFFLFGKHLRLCPWSLALASNIPVLGLESVCPRKGCPCLGLGFFFVSLALASSLVSSTPLQQFKFLFIHSFLDHVLDVVELIVRKYLLLWWSFLCFGSYILQSNLASR